MRKSQEPTHTHREERQRDRLRYGHKHKQHTHIALQFLTWVSFRVITVNAPPGLWVCLKVEVPKSNLEPRIPKKRGMPVSWLHSIQGRIAWQELRRRESFEWSWRRNI